MKTALASWVPSKTSLLISLQLVLVHKANKMQELRQIPCQAHQVFL